MFNRLPIHRQNANLTRLHIDSLTDSVTNSINDLINYHLLSTPFMYIYCLISIDLESSRSFNSPILALLYYRHDPNGTLIVLLGSRAPLRRGIESNFMEP